MEPIRRDYLMRIIFFGSSVIAVPTLEGLAKSGNHQIALVVTRAPKPKGRGLRVEPTPAGAVAERLGLRVIWPERLKEPVVIEGIEGNLRGDRFASLVMTGEKGSSVILVFSYGKIIPEQILKLTPYPICIHPSLLPDLRGPDPLREAIKRGYRMTGLSAFIMTPRLDDGDILLQKEVEIGPDEDHGSLESRLSELAYPFTEEILSLVASGRAAPHSQDHSRATFSKLLKREDTFIDWSSSAFEIHNLVRSLSPSPSAESRIQGQILKILKSRLREDSGDSRESTVEGQEKHGVPLADTSELGGTGEAGAGLVGPERAGVILEFTKEGLIVGTGSGSIEVLLVKPANRDTISARAFAQSRRISVGACFETRTGSLAEKKGG